MRNKYFFALGFIAVVFLSCGQGGITMVKLNGIDNSWTLTQEEAEIMIKELTNCTSSNCQNDLEIIVVDPHKITKLIEAFRNETHETPEVAWFDARYKDSKKYGERHKFGEDSPCMKDGSIEIAGMKTQIIQLKSAHNELYFDVVTICPPPGICDIECIKATMNP